LASTRSKDASSSSGLYYPCQSTFDYGLNFLVTRIPEMTKGGRQVSWPDENSIHTIDCEYLG
jgi:hypothetical protein